MSLATITSYLPSQIAQAIKKIKSSQLSITEVRLRANCPIMICKGSENLLVDFSGRCHLQDNTAIERVTVCDINTTYMNIAEHSLYSYSDEICSGYITIRDGCRVGIAAKAVMANGAVSNFTNVFALNFRVANAINGCASELLKTLNLPLKNIIIAGAPGTGKTTLIRDLARQLSSGGLGKLLKVCIIDERMEIASVYKGIPSFDIGPSTDCVSSLPKAQGIAMAIRTLSPDVIICDEIGSIEEINSVKQCLNSGVAVITTMHASSAQEVSERLESFGISEYNPFNSVILLKDKSVPGRIKSIINFGGQHENNRYDFNNNSQQWDWNITSERAKNQA